MATRADDALSVLHVDDDPELGALVKTYLERDSNGLRCTARTETSPERALTRLRGDGSTCTESKLATALDDGRLLIAVTGLDCDPQ